jgi:hypothetical protein
VVTGDPSMTIQPDVVRGHKRYFRFPTSCCSTSDGGVLFCSSVPVGRIRILTIIASGKLIGIVRLGLI